MTLSQVLMGGSLALLVYVLFSTLLRSSGARRKGLDAYYGSEPAERARQERIGLSVAKRLPFSLSQWEDHLRWAQLGGHFKGWTLGGLVFQALLFGGAGLLVLLLNPAPAALLIPAGLAAYPFVRVRSKANTVRKQAVRALPEAAGLIAAELAASVPVETALVRAAALPGPLAILIQESVENARATGRPLFSRKPVRGAMVEVFAETRLPQLIAFATQLDLVAVKGVGGAELMSEIARSLGQEYRGRLVMEVEKLDSRLMVMVSLFFFVPFVALLLGALMIPTLQMMGG